MKKIILLFQHRKEQAFALLLVLILSVAIIAITKETVLQSGIAQKKAFGEEERLTAEISTLSGYQFFNFLQILDEAINTFIKNNPNEGAMVKNFLNNEPIFKLLQGCPLGQSVLQQNEPLFPAAPQNFKANLNMCSSLISKLDEKNDKELLTLLRTIPGSFIYNIEDESAKLNLNLAARPNFKQLMEMALKRIFLRPLEKKFLEAKKLNPLELVENIIDYLDPDNRSALELASNEDMPYERLNLPYRAKNGVMETLEELRRVPGFQDDDVFDVFAPYFTVWPTDISEQRSINLNTVPLPLLAALVTPETQDVIQEEAFDAFEKDKRGKLQDTRLINETLQTLAGNDPVPEYIRNLFMLQSRIYKIEVQGKFQGAEKKLLFVLEVYDNKGNAPYKVLYARIY